MERLFQPTRPLRGATDIAALTGERLAFQPTRPLRGATHHRPARLLGGGISTHAPLAGRDRHPLLLFNAPSQFQPTRPLRGATATFYAFRILTLHFNPRAPCGARPAPTSGRNQRQKISTHAPLAGRDQHIQDGKVVFPFQPTRPLRGATKAQHRPAGADERRFQPTRPLRGATAKVYKSLCTFLR